MKQSISAPTADAACVRLAGTTDTPELIKYMCQMDYISIDMMGGVLYRTKTLATGGDCCDFHVVKKGSKMDWKIELKDIIIMDLSKVQEIIQIYN